MPRLSNAEKLAKVQAEWGKTGAAKKTAPRRVSKSSPRSVSKSSVVVVEEEPPRRVSSRASNAEKLAAVKAEWNSKKNKKSVVVENKTKTNKKKSVVVVVEPAPVVEPRRRVSSRRVSSRLTNKEKLAKVKAEWGLEDVPETDEPDIAAVQQENAGSVERVQIPTGKPLIAQCISWLLVAMGIMVAGAFVSGLTKVRVPLLPTLPEFLWWIVSCIVWIVWWIICLVCKVLYGTYGGMIQKFALFLLGSIYVRAWVGSIYVRAWVYHYFVLVPLLRKKVEQDKVIVLYLRKHSHNQFTCKKLFDCAGCVAPNLNCMQKLLNKLHQERQIGMVYLNGKAKQYYCKK